MTTRPDTKAIREAFGIDVPVRDYETRSQLALRSLCDGLDKACSQRAALLRALHATLESHDIGHSPCDCVEVRAIVATVERES